MQIAAPSRVICLKNVATFENTSDLFNFRDMYSDIFDKVSQYGKVMGLKIVRPVFVDRTEQNKQADLEKAKLLAEEEELKAMADPKFVKKSERKRARAAQKMDYPEEKLPTQDERNYDFPEGFGNVYVQF